MEMEIYSVSFFCLPFFAQCYVCEIPFLVVAGSCTDSFSLLSREKEVCAVGDGG